MPTKLLGSVLKGDLFSKAGKQTWSICLSMLQLMVICTMRVMVKAMEIQKRINPIARVKEKVVMTHQYR